ncbi:YMGG-like glycine zipper-containing protein [Uliginosibacterium sp. sgz301328]|uniref:YMGG-like glycine zipper-containing protein n=1 Tax=Uliginosibacterium sp. sgz301328 TaxID=3243764 RepID=UPI00359D94CE
MYTLLRLATPAAALLAVVVAGCATPPPSRYAPAPAARTETPIYAYPARGQTEQQTRRDRFECYNWAVNQSGFDPNYAQQAPAPAYVEPAPNDHANTVILAATGAIIGAAVSNPHNAGTGAAIGAVVGGLTGAAADSAQQQDAQRAADASNAAIQRRGDSYGAQSNGYRRAMTACLEGRGYHVR